MKSTVLGCFGKSKQEREARPDVGPDFAVGRANNSAVVGGGSVHSAIRARQAHVLDGRGAYGHAQNSGLGQKKTA